MQDELSERSGVERQRDDEAGSGSPSDGGANPDATQDTDDPSLTEYDKTIADSFPASDPPAAP